MNAPRLVQILMWVGVVLLVMMAVTAAIRSSGKPPGKRRVLVVLCVSSFSLALVLGLQLLRVIPTVVAGILMLPSGLAAAWIIRSNARQQA